MATDSKPNSSTNRALWVIAFALLTIAVCLVVLVLETQLEPELTNAPRPTLAARPAAPKPNLPAILKNPPRAPAPSRPLSPASTGPETVLADSPLPDGELTPLAPPTSTRVVTPGGLAPLTGLVSASSTGEIVGKVVLHGKPPPEKVIDLSREPICASRQPAPLTTRLFVTASDGGLADVLVFIREGVGDRRFPAPAGTRELQFTNCLVEPYISAVQRGQKIQVRNSDRSTHTAHLTPMRNRGYNSGLRRGEVTRVFGFAEQELFVTLRCDIHPWEFAYVSVLPHPFFAVTDKSGSFQITNVPPGDYLLEAIHRKANGTNGITQQIIVRAGEMTEAGFTIEAPAQ